MDAKWNQLRFRKRPVEIEAFQMTEARRGDNSDWPNWLNRAWNEKAGTIGSVYPILLEPATWPGLIWASMLSGEEKEGTDHLIIVTLEGKMRVEWGDWIIRGVQGELYPCKPEIFAATYEAVE